MTQRKGPIENHRAVPWAPTEFGLLETFSVMTDPEGTGYVVEGSCPTCGAHLKIDWHFGNPGYKGVTVSPDVVRPKAGPRTINCDCGHDHAGRPGSAYDDGCGASWKVMLP
ncbi:MAG: hypothetical protein HOV77_01485 [Hamadaea sp.]|uniref:hypothetical protein n=1 Tax=Hamadaea sp. TaxID=2024425 RepID=UPI001810531D|nr:hypothetical protein [Hamadaea sp.]NUT17835.1 hypothetical protein [Hamadaea sp.]